MRIFFVIFWVCSSSLFTKTRETARTAMNIKDDQSKMDTPIKTTKIISSILLPLFTWKHIQKNSKKSRDFKLGETKDMQTAKKQKMNRDELSLYEHEEVRSWRTENEEGADLNLIVVNKGKKSIRIPIKSKIIEYSSGFVMTNIICLGETPSPRTFIHSLKSIFCTASIPSSL